MSGVSNRRPSAAMVVALVALVVALSGSAIAATGLVSGDKLIKRGSLSGNRLRKQTVTGTQIKLSTLAKVPSARTADQATTAANATNATNATTATSATTAVSASNAAMLGGQPPSAYEGRVRWALVDANGKVLAQSGGITVDGVSGPSPDLGHYTVDFGAPVTGHGIIVTPSAKEDVSPSTALAVPCAPGSSDGITCPSFPGAAARNDGNHVLVYLAAVSPGSSGGEQAPFYITLTP